MAKGGERTQTSLFFGDNDKCFRPLSAKANSLLTLEGHFLPGLYRCVWFFFILFFFGFFLEEAASQSTGYCRVTVDLFSGRLLLLGELTSAQISGIDFARASTEKAAVIAAHLS